LTELPAAGLPAPAGLLDAFWEYERALMANDLPALDRLFALGPHTLRGDAAGILVGHDAISDFRKGRGGAPAREILHVEVRELGDAAALVIAVTAPATGGRGQQTQLWQLMDGSWRVTAAHVSLPAPAVNAAVWRVVGTPLVAGAPAGPISGETVAVKDLYEVEGFAVGAGIPDYLAEASPATGTSPAVAALLAAGASVTGIAQTDEFAYSIAGRNPHYGTPPNPAVVGGVPGGSSSGPASAVALGQASIGLGTDTAGSVRVPASYQGLWGLRSTHGSVSVDRLLPLAPTFDSVGWLTRTPALVRAAAGATLDSSLQRSIEPTYVVFPGFSPHIEPDVRCAFQGFLEKLDAPVEVVDLGDVDELFTIFRTVQQAEAWAAHGAWIEAHPNALGADVAARFALAAAVTPSAAGAAREGLAAARSRLDAALGDRVLLLPAASSSAPTVMADAELTERTRQGTLRLTCIAGITGRPGLSVPVLGVPQPGALLPAPVGLGLVGPRFSDLALIDLATDLAARLA
jgi:Asp-tRNA(Asn)/Glu-tRNA(Gln) amidotransferase A subunit family amidase